MSSNAKSDVLLALILLFSAAFHQSVAATRPFQAVVDNDIVELQEAIDQEGYPTGTELIDGEPYTLLEFAASNPNMAFIYERRQIVLYLLENGGDPAIGAPLVESRDLQITLMLIRFGADLEATKRGLKALVERAGDLDYLSTKALLEAGADPSAKDRQGQTPILVVTRGGKGNALLTETKITRLVVLLVQSGADLSSADPRGGNMPIHNFMQMQSERPYTEALATLLGLGAHAMQKTARGGTSAFALMAGNRVHRTEPYLFANSLLAENGNHLLDEQDFFGRTALHYALLSGTFNTVYSYDDRKFLLFLLSRGADPTIRDNRGWSPFAGYLRARCPIERSPESGANNVERRRGRRVRIDAVHETANEAIQQYRRIFNAFLTAGADIDRRSPDGYTPRELVSRNTYCRANFLDLLDESTGE